jgi:hypothetical protein
MPIWCRSRARWGKTDLPTQSGCSVVVPANVKVGAVIAAVGEDAWTPIRCRGRWDDQLHAAARTGDL